MPLLSKKGFTLVELLVTITIIGILASIGIVTYANAQVIGRDSRRKDDLKKIAQALVLFNQSNNHFPCVSDSSGWLKTNDLSTWIVDSNTGSCATYGTTKNMVPNYINKMPTDPKGNSSNNPWSTGNGYGYYSPAINLGASCPAGSYFFLVTQLENQNDKERLGTGSVSVCNGAFTINNASGYSANTFVLTYP